MFPAEGVAQKFRKPLFQITCGKSISPLVCVACTQHSLLTPAISGDLGTTAKEVEYALEKTFALANRWGCVLLLDEADVFLAQRTKEDFKRNGLVAGKSSTTLIMTLLEQDLTTGQYSYGYSSTTQESFFSQPIGLVTLTKLLHPAFILACSIPNWTATRPAPSSS